MALDEALLLGAAKNGTPALRLYGWSTPAATFGYSQRYAEIEALTTTRPLIRRPTGGGLVLHEADWTYAIAIPPSHPWYRSRAEASYIRLHTWLQQGFRLLDIPTELAPSARPEGIGQCFVGAERHDLTREGKKIGGAAQRRTRDGLLIQGSVQPTPVGVDRSDWEDAVRNAARSAWAADLHDVDVDDVLVESTERLVKEKYSQPKHNRRR